ncbi:MAG: DUF1924 domain-containing protein [Candidatus Thiodiazotropha sp. DIVDIV]
MIFSLTQFIRFALPVLVFCLPTALQANALEERVNSYKNLGAGPFSAEQGNMLWQQKVMHTKSGKNRSCQDCHGSDLRKPGRHAKTGKTIDPLSTKVNPQRLSDGKKIEKWFKRNCKWTWGRVCSAQEKGDILHYLKQQ